MNVLTIHCGHSGSITISKDNELIVHTELERFSKFKYSDIVAFDLIKKINELDIFFNLIVISIWQPTDITKVRFDLINKDKNCKIIIEDQFKTKHHIYHAHCAAYNVNKKFDYIVVLDGNGKFNKDNQEEIVSIYDNNFNEVYKEYYKEHVSLGWAYQIVNLALYSETFCSGKTMALSNYGSNVNTDILKDNNFNKDYFKRNLGRYKKDIKLAKEWLPSLSDSKEDYKSLNFVHSFQKACEEYCLNLFNRFKNKKIIFTGGVAQNVLINTRLNNETSNTVYLDPMCNDQGISLGMNLFYTKNNLKNWLTEYTSFKEAGVIIGKLRKMAHEKGWKSNEDKDKLVLSIFERAANAKPEGDIYAYLLVVFKNITSEIKVAAQVDPVRSRWEARAKSYDYGKNSWIFKNCPPPDDPDFRQHCPSQYLHLFGVT